MSHLDAIFFVSPTLRLSSPWTYYHILVVRHPPELDKGAAISHRASNESIASDENQPLTGICDGNCRQCHLIHSSSPPASQSSHQHTAISTSSSTSISASPHLEFRDHHSLSPWRSWIEARALLKSNQPATNGGIKFDKTLVGLLLAIDAIFCTVILYFVPYTEIDWKAYMQEVKSFQSGERDYYKMKGDTGPLVYPAGFVYIFSILRSLTGENYSVGQMIFALFYLLQIAFVLVIAQPTSNVRMGFELSFDTPVLSSPHFQSSQKDTLLLSVVVLSKRLHSIYLLRCFNDGIAMPLAFASIFAAQRKRWTASCILFSLGVSVKMNVLLFAPGFLWLLYDQAAGHKLPRTCGYLFICSLVQVLLGLPFLLFSPVAYLHRAFDFGRVFEYKWTVNWKFIPEGLFVSPNWSILLLLLHMVVLIGLWKRIWIRNRNLSLTKEVFQTYVAFVFYTSNFVGVIFARSLHYQFYSWYFPTVPFLLCHSRGYRFAKILLLVALEYCWNVYPQRSEISLLLFLIHLLLLVGIFTSPLKDLWRREFVPSQNTIELTSNQSTSPITTGKDK